MIRKTKIILINAVLIIILAVIFISVTVFNKPHTDVSENTPNFYLEATNVLEEFQDNETQANTKYLEQVLQITGTISELNITDEKGVISLSDNDSFGSVMCHIDAKENSKLTTLKVGQMITIKGICTGYLMDVVLVKCIILN
ncbi:OB-fold protein [Aquimarina mytili]|uniref:tRNA_anti-like n=1 Tax=Aquimarina mytili TaxID=874423 RepID=A0A937D793_9FLAO|nr:hypothetical protein [Aquimarina mytili]MBL0682855.1 hypothetical protein [Aquimarina mytili]